MGIIDTEEACRLVGRTAAATISTAAYVASTGDTSYEVSANVLVTTYSSGTFTVTCSYTDDSGTSRTLTLNFSNSAGTIGTAIAAADAFTGLFQHIRCKGGTTVTIASTGTFTSLTYNIGASLRRLAN